MLEIQERLIPNCGERFSSSVLWRFFDHHEITFEKVRACRGAATLVRFEAAPRLVRRATRSRSDPPRVHRPLNCCSHWTVRPLSSGSMMKSCLLSKLMPVVTSGPPVMFIAKAQFPGEHHQMDLNLDPREEFADAIPRARAEWT